MKLFLFGGAETKLGQAPILKQMINDVIVQLKPEQLLHVPFARTDVPKEEELIWGEGWVDRDLALEDIELLDARKLADLQKANNYIVFINGGNQKKLLQKTIEENVLLHELILSAPCIIGESAGSAICGQYLRISQQSETIGLAKGLGILDDTLIEGHYTQRNRQQQLLDGVQHSGARYGLGIDSITAAVIDTDSFPEKYTILGDGLVELVR